MNCPTLWANVIRQTEYALACGALEPIQTNYELVEDNGVSFFVRILANLARKANAKSKHKGKKEFNPFLPYEEDLFVCELSDTHLCLLNKYNVIDHHILIITRLFDEQENWLNEQDFSAAWQCLQEIDGLVFYNAGKKAGASQRHKHLQLIPLIANGLSLPIAPFIDLESCDQITNFAFVHALTPITFSELNIASQPGKILCELYQQLLRKLGVIQDCLPGIKQTIPYNLLITREWMMIVLRSQESFESISINSLGFAGFMLVKNPEQMAILKSYGPLKILEQVAKKV